MRLRNLIFCLGEKIMSKDQKIIDQAISREYEYGFVTDIEQDIIPPGLNEDVIRIISDKKNEPILQGTWTFKKKSTTETKKVNKTKTRAYNKSKDTQKTGD